MSITPLIVGIFIAPHAGDPMCDRQCAEAIAGRGLKGDRYARGDGSWNQNRPGSRQVTLINARFFVGNSFNYADSRRNLVTDGIELMHLIGKDFTVGHATLRGVKYCTPCERPTKLVRHSVSFASQFHDCGGLIADVIEGGDIRVDDIIKVRD